VEGKRVERWGLGVPGASPAEIERRKKKRDEERKRVAAGAGTGRGDLPPHADKPLTGLSAFVRGLSWGRLRTQDGPPGRWAVENTVVFFRRQREGNDGGWCLWGPWGRVETSAAKKSPPCFLHGVRSQT